jgi:cation:H+ antiporter
LRRLPPVPVNNPVSSPRDYITKWHCAIVLYTDFESKHCQLEIHLILEILLLIVGIALIFKGSDLFVDASIDIGKIANLPRVVVGGTLVSLATTTPELTVSILAGAEKVPEFALGNALGSVAANIGLILALAAIIRPFKLPSDKFGWSSALLFGLMILFTIITLDLQLPQWRGAILIGVGILYLFVDFHLGRKQNVDQTAISNKMEVKLRTKRRIISFFLLGAIMVIGGSQLLITSGTAIATAIEVPPIFIGLTMVAIGTSLPELATAITSIRKKVVDLSAGNLIGANILNLTTVIGTAACISPLSLNSTTQTLTLPLIFLIVGVFFFLVIIRKRLTRWDGGLLLLLYCILLSALILSNLS